MDEIAGTEQTSKTAKLIRCSNDDEIVEKFTKIAEAILNSQEQKEKLLYSQSFDMFFFIYYENPKKAVLMINEFNEINKEFVKTFGKFPGDNIANIYKAKKHSKILFEQVRKIIE